MNSEMNQHIKLIATDMDGTLLDSGKNLPGDFASVVRALKEKGVSFVVASGRQYAALRRDLDDLIEELIFIAENGALIMEGGAQVFIDPIASSDLAGIVHAVKDLPDVCAVVCRANAALVEKTAPQEFIEHMRMYYCETQVADDLEAVCPQFDDVCKIAFYEKGCAETSMYPVLKARLGDRFAVILSGEDWVDIMKPGVDKGRAVRMLQDIKGISPDACMAFGDYLNDKEMLQSVTESYAMDNALDELKAVCKYVAPSNDEDGVMRVIKERFAL